MVHEFDMTGSPRIRLYVDAPLAADATVAATTDQAHYLRRVMRRGPGDAVALFNGRDGEWRAVIAEVAGKGCVMSVESRMRPQAPGPDPWLLFAPVKRQGVDFLARKAPELGVARLQPVFTHRTAVSRVNVARLRANAVEAAEQCGRLDVPEVRDPMPLDAALENWPRAPPPVLGRRNRRRRDSPSFCRRHDGGAADRPRGRFFRRRTRAPSRPRRRHRHRPGPAHLARRHRRPRRPRPLASHRR